MFELLIPFANFLVFLIPLFSRYCEFKGTFIWKNITHCHSPIPPKHVNNEHVHGFPSVHLDWKRLQVQSRAHRALKISLHESVSSVSSLMRLDRGMSPHKQHHGVSPLSQAPILHSSFINSSAFKLYYSSARTKSFSANSKFHSNEDNLSQYFHIWLLSLQIHSCERFTLEH